MLLFKTFSFTGVIIIPDDYAMIQTGIDMASPGDTIKVKNNIYYESLKIDKDILLTTYGTQKPIITNPIGATITVESAQATVSGFDIQTSHKYGTGILIYGNKLVKIENCTLSGLFTGICALQMHIEINGCLIYDNDVGIFIPKEEEFNKYSSLIANCTIYKNQKGVYTTSYNTQIINSILWNNSDVDIVGSPIMTYSCIEDEYKGTGNIDTDPLFTDELSNDYSLQWNTTNFSPCIDTGDPDEIYNDADGTPSDMGAFPAIEHQWDDWQLPPNSVDNGWKWISFPALDDLTNADDFDGDMAQYMLEDILDYTILDSVIWKPILEQGSGLLNIHYEDGDWTRLNHIFTSPQGYKFNMSDNLGDYEYLEISGE